MRVLLVHNRYRHPGGEERSVELLEQGLRDAGIPTAVVHRDSARELGSRRQQWLTAAALPYRPGGGGIDAAIRRHAPDVVHFHNLWPLYTPSALRAAKRAGAGVVLTMHNYRFACPGGTLYANGQTHLDCIRRSALRCAIRNPRGNLAESVAYGLAIDVQRRLRMLQRWVDVAVCPSEFLAALLVESGFPRDRVAVIRNAVPTPVRVAPLGRTLLYMGRLSEEKGIRTLLVASRRLPADVRLAVAGAGPLEAEVRSAPVTYLGRLDTAGVAAALDDALAAVIPSECYENQPYSALEALAAGRSVVAARVGGLPEIVREGVTGVLVPPRAPDALAARLTDLARDRVLAERLGANARADAARRFALPQQIRALVGVYEGVLSSPSHGRRSLPSRSRVAAGEPS